MTKVIVAAITLFSLTACGPNYKDPDNWSDVVDPGTGTHLRCFTYGDTGFTCYKP